MKFLKSVDNLSHSLAVSQGRIFEKSVSMGIPSKIFIRSYMLSGEASSIDNLNLNISGLSESEILDKVKDKIKNRNGELYSYSIMYYIGYFYRIAAYISGYTSKMLYQNIKPELLKRNYQTLHALPIEEAIKEVFDIANIKEEDKYSLFKKIYKNL